MYTEGILSNFIISWNGDIIQKNKIFSDEIRYKSGRVFSKFKTFNIARILNYWIIILLVIKKIKGVIFSFPLLEHSIWDNELSGNTVI